MNYFPLNLPFDFNLILPDIESDKSQKMHFNLENLIPLDFKKFLLDQFNLKITKSLIFQQLPNTECNIHLDGVPGIQTRSTALNFIFNSEDTYMSWYKILQPSKIFNVYIDNLVIAHYDSHQVEEIERSNLIHFNLVRTNVPHKVVNNSNKIRWCVSMRFNVDYTFEDFVNLFKEYKRV